MEKIRKKWIIITILDFTYFTPNQRTTGWDGDLTNCTTLGTPLWVLLYIITPCKWIHDEVFIWFFCVTKPKTNEPKEKEQK